MNLTEALAEFNLPQTNGAAWNQRNDKVRLCKHNTPSDWYHMMLTANDDVISLSLEGACNDRSRDITMNRIMQVMPYIAQYMREVLPYTNTRGPIVHMHTHAIDGKYTLMHFTIKEHDIEKYGAAMIEAFIYALRRCNLGDIANTINGYIK